LWQTARIKTGRSLDPVGKITDDINIRPTPNKMMKTLIAMMTAVLVCCFAQAKPTELKLIGCLQSGDYAEMSYACGVLPDLYPKSTVAVDTLRGILVSNQTLVFMQIVAQPHGGQTTTRANPNLVIRDTARALGNYHATLSSNELAVINTLLQTRVENDAMDALKAFRGLNNPECVPYVLPELENFSAHVARDAIRTLAVHGDKTLIPRLQPMTNDFQPEVRADAILAIKQLQAKS
jgi:hypothetical protein